MNIQKDWKAKLESAYSFMLRYSKKTVCNDSLAVFCHFWPSKQSHLSFDRKKFPQHMYSIWQYRL